MAKLNISGEFGVTSEPEVIQSKTGDEFTTVRLANSTNKNVNGNWETVGTFWANAIAFGKTGESISTLTKGNRIHLTGELTTKDYTTKAGEARTSNELLITSFGVIPKATATATTQATAPKADAWEDNAPF